MTIGEEIYDLAIIGGGPGGYVAAIRAAQLGSRVVLVEKDVLGGTCLNRGCIPTKTLLKSVKAFKDLKKLKELAITGIDLSGAQIDLGKLQQRKSRIVKRLTTGVAGLLKARGVEVVPGEAVMDEEPGLIKVRMAKDGQGQESEQGQRNIRARHVIIATGSKPRLIPLPGIDSPSVLTSDEILSLESVPSTLVILGGGVIGLEFALIFRELGADVTIVEMEERLLPAFDEEIAAEAGRMLKSSGITLHLGARAQEIREDTLIFEKDGERKEIKGEKILVAVGRAPVYEGIDVQKLGLKTERGALVTDEFLRTSQPAIYAIGDVNGKYMLAHKASAEGLTAVENILGTPRQMDYGVIPQCIYSSPEIACVGLSEKQAREKYGEDALKVTRFPLSANGKAQVEGETRGFVKVIAEQKTGKILGVHLFCHNATELIAEAVTAIRLGARAEDLAQCIHPHPTMSEAVQEAYFAAEKEALHFMP